MLGLRLSRFLLTAVLATTTVAAPDCGPDEAAEPDPGPGRFLYAGDDDWDWASPLNAEKPSRLVRYGAMPWSALDWAERGLKDVRGALIGTAPNPKLKMSMEELSDLRGERATYRHHPQAQGVIARLLKEEAPPNVIILMQNTGKDGELDAAAIETLTGFVKAGGRLVVLDDWKRYHSVLDHFVGEALKLPAGPPLEDDPAPRKAIPQDNGEPAAEDPIPSPSSTEGAGQPKTDPQPDDNLRERFADLLPQLGTANFQAREDATTALRDLGPRILPLLMDTKADDPEIAARLAQLRRHFTPKTPAVSDRKVLTQEERDAQRAAKHETNARLIRTAASKLREAKIPHRVSDVLVDKEGRALPALRIAFPLPN